MINTHYKGKAKKFILKLLKDYIKVNRILQNMQREFYGILSYEHVFDISKTAQITVFKKNTTTYQNDFNIEFNNDTIYNETSQNNISPTNQQNSINNSNAMDYMMLDFTTNIYDQVGNDYLYTNLLKTKMKETLEKIQELLKKLYTTKKQNLYEMFRLIFQIDFYTQQFIFYYANPQTYQKSLEIKDYIYKWISARIEIYDNFISEFIYWIKAINNSAQDMELTIQDPRLKNVFKDFTKFYHDLFDNTQPERRAKILEKLKQMGITYEVKIPDFDEVSDIELKELLEIISELEKS